MVFLVAVEAGREHFLEVTWLSGSGPLVRPRRPHAGSALILEVNLYYPDIEADLNNCPS